MFRCSFCVLTEHKKREDLCCSNFEDVAVYHLVEHNLLTCTKLFLVGVFLSVCGYPYFWLLPPPLVIQIRIGKLPGNKKKKQRKK